MKKEAVYTELEYHNMVFRYKGKNGTYDLFQTRYRQTIYEYFRYGRGIDQLHADRSWLKSRFLSKIVEERLWKEIRRVRKEDADAGRGNEGLD